MKEKSVIFLGDSIMEWAPFEVQETFLNLSVSGETTETLLNRVQQIKHLKPKKVFLMVGVNDLAFSIQMEYILENYGKILDELLKVVSNAEVFCISLLPTDDKIVDNETICILNERIKRICKMFKVNYIDVYSDFLDKNNNIDNSYRFDLFTLNERGYQVLNKNIMKNI